jgi:hypothetical protein
LSCFKPLQTRGKTPAVHQNDAGKSHFESSRQRGGAIPPAWIGRLHGCFGRECRNGACAATQLSQVMFGSNITPQTPLMAWFGGHSRRDNLNFARY